MREERIGYHVTKRAFDVAASALGLVVTSPVWLAAVIGIELSDPGPVFYMANRVGYHNTPFRMFKFRSMRVDNQANEKSFRADAGRIFPWGAFMRNTKIDELPQLLNVFLGDMSVVGPRPASVDQAAITRGGKYAQVGSVKPGLSGPSALYDYIYGDSITDETEYQRLVLPTRMELDRYYISNACWKLDGKMIAWTVGCIANSLFRRSSGGMLEKLISWAESMEEQTWTKKD